jgi:hypothetical protein
MFGPVTKRALAGSFLVLKYVEFGTNFFVGPFFLKFYNLTPG